MGSGSVDADFDHIVPRPQSLLDARHRTEVVSSTFQTCRAQRIENIIFCGTFSCTFKLKGIGRTLLSFLQIFT